MNKRILWITLGGVALLLVLGLGAAGGAALTYVFLQGVPRAAAAALTQAAEDGILIAAVDPDGPAAKAGLRRGDILLEVAGQPVNDLAALRQALRDNAGGGAIGLTVQRGDERLSLTANLAEGEAQAYLGLTSCGEPGRTIAFGPGAVFAGELRGALITEVLADTPAATAGLEVGDHILAVDGRELAPDFTLADALAAHKPGDSVTLTVTRPEAEARKVTVTLGEDPDEAGKAYLGVRYFLAPGFSRSDILPPPFGAAPFEHDFFLDLPDDLERGVVIGKVVEGGPAAAAGLQAGDVITAINDEPLESPRALTESVAGHKPGEVLRLTVRRAGESEPLTIAVTLGEHPDQAGRAYLGVSALGFFERHMTPGEPAWPFELPRREDRERRPGGSDV